MAQIYYDLIILGLRKVEDVPSAWKDQVQKMFE
ncbi:CD1375 family protein [Paenibacillus alvei]